MIAETHWALALGLMLIAGFGSWVFIHSNRSYLLRWAIIPVSVIVAVLSARLYDVRLGYAVPADLPPKFMYLGHRVIVEKKRKTGIEVWVQTASTRLYRIPYSKPVEEAMDKAREQAKGGQPVLMRKRETAGTSTRDTSTRAAAIPDSPKEAAYESNVMLPSDLDPKS
jgi:hypothetical protein